MADSVLNEDFDNIEQCQYISFDKMKDSTIFITGATGLIGSLLAKVLHYVNIKRSLNLKIIVLVRDLPYAEKMFKGYDLQFIKGDIRYLQNINVSIDYIFHCAAVTSSEKMISDPIGNIETAINGTQNILKLGQKQSVKSIVYVSSMEVYGFFSDDLYEVTEKDMGYIELTNPRSCYPEGKRMCECMCHCYYSQYKLPIKIARLAQTFGAGVSFTENRVFAQFAKSAMKKQDIILHTKGDSYGNYCYTADAIKALLLLLLDGKDGQIYNVSNEENNMSINQMAQIVSACVSGGFSKVIIDLPKDNSIYGYASPVKIKLMTSKLQDLDWKPIFSVIDMYKRMILYWNEQGIY